MAKERARVAIACQGGGSHTAFTAGVLLGLLDDPRLADYELAGLSGASGGAVCAALAWSGLLSDAADPSGEAARRLTAFWSDMSASAPLDALTNFWGQVISRLPVTAEISPHVWDVGAARQLSEILERHLAFPRDRDGGPKLLVAVTDILEGCGRIICGEDLTIEDIVASAAVPPLFKAVATRGTYLWDGLFSHNPPVRALTDLRPKPDEIWVIQINPEKQQKPPQTMAEIIDRRNELSGNLSMLRELDFIDRVNTLIGYQATSAGGKTYKPIVIKVLTLPKDLDYASKFNRDPGFIDDLLALGRAGAAGFFGDGLVRKAATHDICWRGAAPASGAGAEERPPPETAITSS